MNFMNIENITEWGIIITAIGTCIIAIASICNAWHQRKHNRLSLRPYLTNFINKKKNNKLTSINFQIINKGLGTAYIKKFKLLDKEENIYDFQEKMEEILEEKGIKNRTITNLAIDDNPYAIFSNETETLLEIRNEDQSFTLEKLIKELEQNFILEIDYESIYGEKFSMNHKKKL